jgi:hypothetical protein
VKSHPSKIRHSSIDVMSATARGIAFALGAAAALTACGPSSRSGAGSADAATGPCAGSDKRCAGNTLQACVSGQYQDQQACSSDQVCSVTLGCAQCNPDLPKTCKGNDVVSCNADGTFGTVIETCQVCSGGSCATSCTADGVDLVYVVDDTNRLLSFNPRKLAMNQEPFSLIGTLSCPTQMPPLGGSLTTNPFSMSVDRNGVAWVLYNTGEIFNVSLQNAACTKSSYAALQQGMKLFGMGFVTDTPGSASEKLFIGGGDETATVNGRLAKVDTTVAAPAPQILGNLTAVSEQTPELTGTSEAKLYGFYPGASKAFVQEVDRTNGAPTGREYLIPNGLGGMTQAWAFAQWGGKFYIFVTSRGGGLFDMPNSTVRVIDRTSGAYSLALEKLPYQIVGAGVSTCAPVVVE